MEAQSWANQTEAEEPLGELENNMAKKDTMIPTPSTVSTDTIAHKVTTFPTANTNSIPAVAHEATPNPLPSAIPSSVGAPANLWDSNFAPVSLFGIDYFLAGGSNSIACSPKDCHLCQTLFEQTKTLINSHS